MLALVVRTVAVGLVLALASPAPGELTKEETGRNTPYPQDNGGTGACDNYRCGCGDSCGCGAGCGCGSSTAAITVRGASFESENITLLSRVSVDEFGSEFFESNDCWGYVSPSGREYALVGLNSALAVVEITDPANPVILGDIDHPSSPWADVKTYGSYAYVVNEDGGGVQVVDLSDVDAGKISLLNAFDVDGDAETNHNIAINVDSGFAYLCGSNGLNGGLVALDLSNPVSPLFAGAYTSTYVHDAEIVSFTDGPYAGREIAFCYSGFTGLDIVDVTNKSNMVRLSRTSYAGQDYTHQGWLDQTTMVLYLNDELDERNGGTLVSTRVFDVADLSSPELIGSFSSGHDVIDHNLYVRDGFIFEANYRSGLRIFDATGDAVSPTETGWFDTFNGSDDTEFDGAWSVYPFFPSGTVIVSDIQGGLFVLDPSFAFAGGTPARIELVDPEPLILAPQGQTLSVRVSASLGFALADAPRLVVAGVSYDLTPASGDLYTAEFPDLPCGQSVSYFFEVGASTGATVREPLSAPVEAFTGLVASSFDATYEDEFESSSAWTVGAPGDTAETGVWERTIPNETSAAPGEDFTPGNGIFCYVTGDAGPGGGLGDNDVDGGATTLTSPLLDATGDGAAFIEYARWYSNDRGAAPNEDTLFVEISNDDGDNWTALESVTENASAWVFKRFRIDEFLAPTSTMRVRFIAGDLGDPSVVEAGVDDVRIRLTECVFACPGDLNGSGAVDSTDLAVLLAAWGGGDVDLNGDGNTDSADIAVMLAAWGACP